MPEKNLKLSGKENYKELIKPRQHIHRKYKIFSVFLSSFRINLLTLYHECRSLIGYATHCLFCDR